MKKYLVFFFFCFTICLSSANISAQCKDLGQNNSNGYVKSTYDCATGDLWAYGYNGAGNLGIGNYNNVIENNKVKLNEKIGNKKIIDYYFGLSSTYLLTSDNKVYASGYSVGNGSTKKINKFVELYFYKSSTNKITTIAPVEKIDSSLKSNDKNERSIKFTTTKANINYYFDNVNWAHCYPAYVWTVKDIMLNNLKDSRVYPIYVEKKANIYYETVINRKKQFVYSYVTNTKNKTYISKKYKDGKIATYKKFSKTKDVYYNYKNGKKISGSIIYYKSFKEKAYKDWHLPKKRYNYYYNSKQQIIGRKAYTYTFKKKNYDYAKANLVSKKEYKRNKKGELKTNKNGRAYSYITYYKKGKAKKTYRYNYNKSGKIINKKLIKTRK